MAHYLPPQIMALFIPRPPLEVKGPHNEGKPAAMYTGVGEFLKYFANPDELKPLVKSETPIQKKQRRKEKNLKRSAVQMQIYAKKCKQNYYVRLRFSAPYSTCAMNIGNPKDNPQITSDPLRTVFIGRIVSYTLDSISETPT